MFHSSLLSLWTSGFFFVFFSTLAFFFFLSEFSFYILVTDPPEFYELPIFSFSWAGPSTGLLSSSVSESDDIFTYSPFSLFQPHFSLPLRS